MKTFVIALIGLIGISSLPAGARPPFTQGGCVVPTGTYAGATIGWLNGAPYSVNRMIFLDGSGNASYLQYTSTGTSSVRSSGIGTYTYPDPNRCTTISILWNGGRVPYVMFSSLIENVKGGVGALYFSDNGNPAVGAVEAGRLDLISLGQEFTP
jgi:hypothetical protein